MENPQNPGAPQHGEGQNGHEEGVPPKRKHRGGHEKQIEVSINSLLDVLSVILVFLMKGYSTSAVQIKPSKDLQVPVTHSQQELMESTCITITLKNIMVDDVPVTLLDNGKIAEQDLGSGGFLIDPLMQKLLEEVAHLKKIAERNKKMEFNGVVTIVADRHIPSPLLARVMYTAGQAEFGKFKFALVKLAGS